MKKIIIKENSNAKFFKKLKGLGCFRAKVKSGGRGEYSATGTTGKQGRHTYIYPTCLHSKVVDANNKFCFSPKTSIFLDGERG